MAGRIWIGPYKPLGVSTKAVPGGGYLNIDASAGNFGPSPLAQLGLQAAQGVTGIAGAVAEQLAGDNEAVVKIADTRMGETEQALLFDSQNGYLSLQGQDAVAQAPAVLDTYTKAQDRERATLTDDDQRRMFGELADRRLATFSTQVDRHAAAERQRWYDTASEHRIALMQADAGLHWNDDALLRRSLGTARAEVRDQAARNGWDSAQTEAALHRQTSRTLASAIGAAVDHDPKRARELRTRYATALEDHHLVALDALLAEAETRERAAAASVEILNAAPPNGEQPTPHWRLQQAEAITDPSVRTATIRRLDSAAAADEARARALGEQVLAGVLKDGLTDPSQIPVREWAALDAERRQAIDARLHHNAAGTEPAPNPALVDELATQMTQAPYDFARRDLVPRVGHLPLQQWQRFRDWQSGLRRNDPTTEDEVYAIKRGLQIARQSLPKADPALSSGRPSPLPTEAEFRAALVEDIDTARKITGKSPDDAALGEMVRRDLPDASLHNIYFPITPQAAELGAQVIDELMRFAIWLHRLGPALRLPSGLAPPAPPSITVPIGPPFIGDPERLLMFLSMLIAILQSQNRMARRQSPPAPTPPLRPRQAPTATMPSTAQPGRTIAPQGPTAKTVPHSPDAWWIPPGPRASGYPSRIDPKGQDVYHGGRTGGYVIYNTRGRQGFWIAFDERGELVGVYDVTLSYFTPRDQLSPEQVKEWTRPEIFPADDSLPPPLVGTPIPEPQLPDIEAFPAPPPKFPEIEIFPALPPAKPQIMESETPPLAEEPRHKHHEIPQELWQLGKLKRFPFSPKARKIFDGFVVEVPRSKHWGELHAAYNREIRKAMEAYLDEKARKHNTTRDGYAENMDEGQALECYEKLKEVIRNLDDKSSDDAKYAKEFLSRIQSYQQKKAGG